MEFETKDTCVYTCFVCDGQNGGLEHPLLGHHGPLCALPTPGFQFLVFTLAADRKRVEEAHNDGDTEEIQRNLRYAARFASFPPVFYFRFVLNSKTWLGVVGEGGGAGVDVCRRPTRCRGGWVF